LSRCGPVYAKGHVGLGLLQSLILDWSKLIWGGPFAFTLGFFGPKPNQMVLGEKSCWNFTWHALDNVTWDFVLFFQAHLLEVGLVKIVRVQLFQKKSTVHL
jgi:hypothetical protein